MEKLYFCALNRTGEEFNKSYGKKKEKVLFFFNYVIE